VLVHKIDRSARNLRDWAELGELIDNGVEVHFVNESLDLSSRGGRLSADIQAVVAADYIRNLREENKKGLLWQAQAGLLSNARTPRLFGIAGAGKAKIPDPVRLPYTESVLIFIRRANTARRHFQTSCTNSDSEARAARSLNKTFWTNASLPFLYRSDSH